MDLRKLSSSLQKCWFEFRETIMLRLIFGMFEVREDENFQQNKKLAGTYALISGNIKV